MDGNFCWAWRKTMEEGLVRSSVGAECKHANESLFRPWLETIYVSACGIVDVLEALWGSSYSPCAPGETPNLGFPDWMMVMFLHHHFCGGIIFGDVHQLVGQVNGFVGQMHVTACFSCGDQGGLACHLPYR
jgi:hypothetical protein